MSKRYSDSGLAAELDAREGFVRRWIWPGLDEFWCNGDITDLP
jgi:hypothetical protein